jgi:acyl dehydratase
VSADDVEIGHEIPRLEIVVTAEQVRRYATVAQMPGQRFVSDEVARKEGLPGRILPGNMSMALLSRMLHEWLPQARIERLGVTFRGIVQPDQTIHCSGFVTDRRETDDEIELECDLILEQGGERRTTGLAVLRLDRGSPTRS